VLLQEYLYNGQFPKELELYMQDYVSVATTPGLFGEGSPDRPQWYYANCLIDGMVLGRAFALLATPARAPTSLSAPADFPFSRLPAELRLQIYDYYKEDCVQRQRYWSIMTRIFIKALWSGRAPEEGARYIAGIIILCAGHAMSQVSPMLRGHGAKWIWWDDRFSDPDYTWTFHDLHTAIMSTASLPRTNTQIASLRQRWKRVVDEDPLPQHHPYIENPEYVSRQTLEVLDLAREHLRSDERDWTPPELVAKLLNRVYEGKEEARNIWTETGFVPRALEESLGVEVDDGRVTIN
jgi:hypothetical protein